MTITSARWVLSVTSILLMVYFITNLLDLFTPEYIIGEDWRWWVEVSWNTLASVMFISLSYDITTKGVYDDPE